MKINLLKYLKMEAPMPNILESLYHGSLFPSVDFISKDPSYRPKGILMSWSLYWNCILKPRGWR
ncbi:hypothetical protein C171_26374 [Paenibacillus sp. FSL H8-237]|nr:hypothetical protein C171_26374 [Paenibacillus sp. FSL H8-237]